MEYFKDTTTPLLPQEIWKQIPGYPDYEASNFGRIRSWKRKGGCKTPPKILKQIITRVQGRYHRLVVSLRENGIENQLKVAHLILFAFAGPQPDNQMCCHWDGNSFNNILGNLRWDTRLANKLDDRRLGVKPRSSRPGEDHPGAKLKNADILAIRYFGSLGIRYEQIAEFIGTTAASIQKIVIGKRWKHIGGPRTRWGKGRKPKSLSLSEIQRLHESFLISMQSS